MGSDSIKDRLIQLHDGAFGWAMSCCHRDRDLAAEVLQQSYCRILAGDAAFKGQSEFSTWVFGVIRRVALEEARRRKRNRNQVESIRVKHKSADYLVESHQVKLEQQELSEQLFNALQRLSARQREVLHLTFYEEMTVEQAAEVLEISVGSARQHYQRGKDSLRRILAASREFER